jgi:hypothetical protein
MPITKARPEPEGPGLRRRDFLALGSTLALSPLFSDLAFAQSLVTTETGVRPLPVGFLEGSTEVPDLRHLSGWMRQPGIASRASWEDGEALRVVPAPQLFQGDTDLIGRPLRLSIRGLYPPAALERKQRRELPVTIDLDVLFPAPEPAVSLEPVRFHAWSFRRRPGWNPSPPIKFTYPLDWQALPEIEIRVVPAGGRPPVRMRTRFTFDDEPGLPKLQRGLYLLGTVPDVWRSSVSVSALARTAPVELVSVLLSVEPVEEPTE